MFVFLSSCTVMASASNVIERRRVALLFGNDSYPRAQLNSCCKDARDMSKALTSLGFHCTVKCDANKKQMEQAESDLRRRIQTGDCILIYFSGHGQEEKVEIQLGATAYEIFFLLQL